MRQAVNLRSSAREVRGARIGRFAAEFGLNPRTLRYYESLGLLQPARTAAGYRVYGPSDRRRLRFVLRAKRVGLSLRDIAEILRIRDSGRAPCEHVEGWIRQKLAALDRQLHNLLAMRRELVRLRRRARSRTPGEGCVCSILEG